MIILKKRLPLLILKCMQCPHGRIMVWSIVVVAKKLIKSTIISILIVYAHAHEYGGDAKV